MAPCACAMAFRVADAAAAFDRAISLGARPFHGRVGPMELNIPAIEGIGGSLIYFVDRYGPAGSIWDVDFRPIDGRRPASDRRRPDGDRPPDAQRPSRPHGCLGRLLRTPLQLPRDPLLRHRGQADRPEVQGHDQPLRPDPHPDQRKQRRPQPDRGIPARLQWRGHPAHRHGHDRHPRQRRGPGGVRRALPRHARHLLRTAAAAPAGHRRGHGAPGAQPHPDGWLAAPAGGCCRSSPTR